MGIKRNRGKKYKGCITLLLAILVTAAQILSCAVSVYALTEDTMADTLTEGFEYEDPDVGESLSEDISDETLTEPDDIITLNEETETASESMIISENDESSNDATGAGTGSISFAASAGTTTATVSEGADGLSVARDDTTGVITLTISKAGTYSLTGQAMDTVVEVKKEITGVTLKLSDLTIDDSNLSSVLGKDSPVISLKSGAEVTFDLTGTNTVTGSNGFVTEPQAVIKGATGSKLAFTGTGLLTVSDSMSEGTVFTYEGNAVDPADGISAKEGVISFSGGTVNISGANGSGVKAKEGTVNVNGGTLNISNTHDDAVKVKDGTINVSSGQVNISNSYGDGLKAKMENVSGGGNIIISGGTVNITDEIYGDGIQGENVVISGGTVNVTTVFNNASTGYYTSGNTSTTLNTITEQNDKYKTERINIYTGDHAGIKAGTKACTKIYKDLQSTDPGNAIKAYAASGGITITGGTVTVNTLGAGLKANRATGYTACANGVYIIGSPDDAIHSNNSIMITGGTIIIDSSDDGLSAAGNLSIMGNSTSVDIRSSFEGIEGSDILFGTSGSSQGPTVSIVSDDDGINAAHKTNVTYTYDSSDDEDCNYTKTTEKTGGNKCIVYSGTVTIKIDSTSSKTRTLRNGSSTSTKSISYKADGDGIDCNGTLDLEGGTTVVFGSSPSTSNSPIDTDEGFTLGTEAVLLASGSDGMNESKPENGGGTYIYYGGSSMGGVPGAPGNPGAPGIMNDSFEEGIPGGGMPGDSSASINAGSIFKVTSGSTVLTETTLPYAASFLIFASPALAAEGSYTATINGSSITMTKAAATASGSGIPGGNTPAMPTQPTDPTNPTNPVNPTNPINPTDPGNPTDPVKPEEPVATTPVKKITLNSSKVSLGVGRTYQLSVASVTPADANPSVTWSSADSSIASVDQITGLVTAVSTGLNSKGIPNKTKAVRITATASDGSGKTAVCTVTVGNAVTGIDIYLNGDKNKTLITDAEVARAKKIKLIPVYKTTYSDQGMTVPMNKTLTWISSDESVATVTNGVITAIRQGEVTITARTTGYAGCAGGNDVTASCRVKVIVPVTSSRLNKVISVEQGSSYDMNKNLYILPADAEYSVKWSSSDSSVAWVDESTGVLKASSENIGNAKVTAVVTSKYGKYVKTLTKNVKVVGTLTDKKKEKTKITLNKTSVALGSKANFKLTVAATPAVYEEITFSSSDLNVATVDDKGLVTTGTVNGTAIITAKMNGFTASCKVICQPVTNDMLILNTSKYESLISSNTQGLAVGKSVRLTATINGKAANKKLIWASSNPYDIRVKNGVVTAVGAGSATIRVYAADNPDVYKQIEIKSY